MKTTLVTLIWLFAIASVSWSVEFNSAKIGNVDGCSIVIVSQGSGLVTNNVNFDGSNCGDKDEFNVKYVWMNSNQLAEFWSDPNAHPFPNIFGSNPKILENDITEILNRIRKDYTIRIAETGYPANADTVITGLSTADGLKKEMIVPNSASTEGLFRTNVSNQTIALPVSDPIIWVDNAFVRKFSESKWSGNYSFRYSLPYADGIISERSFLRGVQRSAERNWSELSRQVAMCINFIRFVDRPEFNSYWDSIDELVWKEELQELASYYSEFDGQGDKRLDSPFSYNIAYDFIDEFAIGNWPDDFLLLRGSFEEATEGCEVKSGGLAFYLLPRELYVQFAVITPISPTLKISNIHYQKDGNYDVRKSLSDFAYLESNVGEILLQKSQSQTLVIPLSTQFRYPEQILEHGNLQLGSQLKKVFDAFPDREINFDNCSHDEEGELVCDELASSTLGEMPESDKPFSIEPRYYFGEALKLDALTIDGKLISARVAPEFGLYSEDEVQAGSCPFVFFEMKNGDILRHGRVLIGASSPLLARTDTIPIPKNAKKIIISELEPEISYIDSLTFDDISENVRPINFNASSDSIMLKPREFAVFDVPERASTVSISGFYELLK